MSVSTTRRHVLQTAVGIGGLAVVPAFNRSWAQAPELAITPAQTQGPFYPVTKPLDVDGDLTVIKGGSGRALGKIIHLMGRVLNGKGAPVRGAKIELWQANARGRYAHPDDVNPAPLDPNFQGYGIQTTDDDGQYRFKTIKPAAYPINPMNPVAMRTPHIHFTIVNSNTRLVTQMYFPDEANAADRIFDRLTTGQRAAATAAILPATADQEPDSLLIRWDVVLAAG